MNTYDTVVTAVLVGPSKDDEGWEHFLWDVTLTRHGVIRDAVSFPYRMGLAHQRTKCGKPMPTTNRYRPTPENVCGHVTCASAGFKPVPPSLYDVLCSLKADATDGRSFSEWCGDYGMDTDSRKALDLYLACEESEVRSRKFFGSDWPLIVADEDYQ
jgi:hypothetical protein